MRAALLALLVAVPAAAEPAPQVQADLGLTIIGVGYERPVASHVSVQIEAGIFGTYFLPWFDLGDNTIGGVVGVRPTWFARADGRGLYIGPYVRAVRVTGTKDGVSGTGYGWTAGAFVGWGFGLTERLDARVGVGAQYLWFDADPLRASTPFAALDLVVGYRL